MAAPLVPSLMEPAGRRRLAGWFALASIGGVLLATLSPWLGLAPMRIPAAWCLVCGGAWVMDAVSNVLLFLPVGVTLTLRGWPLRRVVLLAFVLSLFVETMQSYGIPPSRSPSASDLLTNTIGGLLGAFLVRWWHILQDPAPTLARRLTATATVATAMIFALTAVALEPRSPAIEGADELRLSRFDYAPGYGWYGGRLQGVTVNDWPVPHDGSGPAVVMADRVPPTLSVTATLRGRDTAWYTRAMVFVHPTSDTLPTLLLSQRGDHLELHIERRGSDWGLYMPYLRLARVLRSRTPSDTTRLQITGRAATGQLELMAQGRSTSAKVTRALPPTIGWTMLQSVIGPTHPSAPIVHALWLLALCAPIGWWSGRSPQPRQALGLAAGVVGGALSVAAWHTGLPFPGWGDWITIALVLVGANGWSRYNGRTGRSGYIAA